VEECVFGLEDGGGWHLARFIYWKIHAHMMNDVMAIGFSRGRLSCLSTTLTGLNLLN
jgi:hypothetical protein